MYEKLVIHAIQNTDVNDFQTRYRMYKTKEERDRVYDSMLRVEGNRGRKTKVTLTVTAETVSEQLELGI